MAGCRERRSGGTVPDVTSDSVVVPLSGVVAMVTSWVVVLISPVESTIMIIRITAHEGNGHYYIIFLHERSNISY